MRVLLWHVHGSYTDAFVRGDHDYLLPVLPHRTPGGRGRARTWHWPENVHELGPAELAAADVDVVVLQRPFELEVLAEAWLGGRRPGVDLPAIYLEHNTPPSITGTPRHPAADRPDLLLVHVTHFNALMWDTGKTPVRVIEHGVPDPGHRYRGEQPRAAAVINEPVRRGRICGTDVLARFAEYAPVDLFGLGTADLDGHGNRPQHELHDELARRRLYVHPYRWTSLGLSLLEAMALGVPVVAFATTEASRALADGAGICSNDWHDLGSAISRLVEEPEAAAHLGARGRQRALSHYGLDRFLCSWNRSFEEVAS